MNNKYHTDFLYVEKSSKDFGFTKILINNLSYEHIIYIQDYRDVFNNGRKTRETFDRKKQVIIAKKKEAYLYPNADTCQSFGYGSIFYSTLCINCLMSCDYCFLQGLYPSPDLVFFCNIEDYADEFIKLNSKMSAICQNAMVALSYETDILYMAKIAPYLRFLKDTFIKCQNIDFEIRTKSVNTDTLNDLSGLPNIIAAFTLSPQDISRIYEHNPATLSLKLEKIAQVIKSGIKVRICFDPLLFINDFEKIYPDFFSEVFEYFKNRDLLHKIHDVSAGAFRMPSIYLKNIKKNSNSSVITYPYTTVNGLSAYPEAIEKKLIDIAKNCIEKYIPLNKIYLF